VRRSQLRLPRCVVVSDVAAAVDLQPSLPLNKMYGS
jgi:hypothetical protein